MPALARTISIGAGPSSPCSAPTVSLGVSYEEQFVASCEVMANITASSSSPVSDYRWSIDGTYVPEFDGQATIALRVDVSQPTRQVAVAAVPACGGAAVVTARSFTTYFPGCQQQSE